MWREALPELRRIAEIYGLQPRETEFFEVTAHELYALAATGLPGMYSHWSFGRNYERERTRNIHGRATIYELVVNLDPVQAYLLDQNSDAEQAFVAAHVLGHVDLFGRNAFHRQQRPDMDRVVSAASLRFETYAREHGPLAVERLIDAAHMLMWHATPEELAPPRPAGDAAANPYAPLFPDAAPDPDAPRARLREDCARVRRGIGERDLLRFLIAHAPLEDWERDVLSTVREVALYFLPQTRIKILAEGWASFWHKRILRAWRAPQAWAVQEARLHAWIANPPDGRLLNPYWLGLTILEHLAGQGVDILELVREESDRSLVGRIDERLVYENDTLRDVALRIDEAREPGDPTAWEMLRDALVRAVPVLPEVDVRVREWDARRLVLEADAPVEERYARVVLAAMARLWQGEAVLVAPGQELKGVAV
ncbi:MAG: SpoVR family protein, partial [Clostridia bacterium]|nr:SpoVR family protein [Clostridia bacterium]